MADFDARAENDKLELHIRQVEAGLIPKDSPPDFTLPQPPDGRGLPWWFGPDYKPTPEALDAAEREWRDGPHGPAGP